MPAEKGIGMSTTRIHADALSSAEATAARPRVVVIDDDAGVLEVLQNVLHDAFEVRLVRKALEAEAVVREAKPSLILLDLRMPDIDGLTLCRRLRADPENDFTPIVFLTAYVTHRSRIDAYQAGAEDILAKPFDLEELRAKVRVWTRLAVRADRLRTANERLIEQVRTDALTGLASRRYALDLLDTELERFARYGSPVSVLLVDVDDFKRINDDFGHAVGDEALKAAARHIEKSLRKNDHAARYGGDEFLVILANSGLEAAEAVCRKLQMEHIPVEGETACPRLSLSIGAAAATKGSKAGAVIDAADMAMLVAKSKGKGRFHLHQGHAASEASDGACELRLSRSSLREMLCRICGSLLAQFDREGDLLGVRTDLALGIGDEMGCALQLPPDEQETLRNAMRLVRFEQINLPWEIASARPGLTPEQHDVLRATMERNIRCLHETGFLEREAEVLESLHEWWDGSGFPAGARGESIPLLSRVLALTTAYALLREGGPHTRRHERDEALALIRNDAGVHLDPGLSSIFLEAEARYYGDAHDQGGGSILLVEDHPPIAAVLQRRLEAAGYAVRVADNLAKARTALDEASWRAVLLDLMLPDGSGLDLLRELRGDAATERLPVAVLSSRFDREAVQEAKAGGAFVYAVKPVRFEPLLRALSALPEPGASREAPPAFSLIAH